MSETFTIWFVAIAMAVAIAHTCYDIYRTLRGLWKDDTTEEETREATDVNLVSSGFEEIMTSLDAECKGTK